MSEDSTPPVFAAERQEKIAAFVASRGKIRLDELASVFEVSQPTLRKDLTVLEQQGLLKRTHGGALSIRTPGERDLMTRFVQTSKPSERSVVPAVISLRRERQFFSTAGQQSTTSRNNAACATDRANELTEYR